MQSGSDIRGFIARLVATRDERRDGFVRVWKKAKWARLIDQYRVKEDKRSGIRSDPNNPDDPEYIVRLIGQVVRVSVETVKIVRSLPERYASREEPAEKPH